MHSYKSRCHKDLAFYLRTGSIIFCDDDKFPWCLHFYQHFLWLFLSGTSFLWCKNLFVLSNPSCKLLSSSQLGSENHLDGSAPDFQLPTDVHPGVDLPSCILSWEVPLFSPRQWTALSSNRVKCSVWELNFLTMDFLNPCCFSSIGYLVHYILCNFVYWCLGVNNCILMRKNDLNYSSNMASYGMQC